MGYEITWEAQGVVKRFFGDVSNDDLMKSSTVVQADARFDDLHYVLLDFHDCLSHSVTDPALLEIAAIDEAASDNQARSGVRQVHVAIIATDSKIIDLAKRYANYKFDVVLFGLFFNRADARSWLN